ncbi:MAG TPA: LacI family DNA-binding transcriptional regulator [Candidatus Koribacter sp.]
MANEKKATTPPTEVVTLRQLAEYLGLTPGTVSAVLNNAPSAAAIPQRTKDRIFAAADKLKYRPNFFARTLRKKRTYTVAVIAREIGDPSTALIFGGIEAALSARNFFYLTVVHHSDPNIARQYSQMLLERGVEGILTVDVNLTDCPSLPTVAIAGQFRNSDMTNVVLDYNKAARLALGHLRELNHKDIAYLRGRPTSMDAEERWRAICEVGVELGNPIRSELALQLDPREPSIQQGYQLTRDLLARGIPFTAIFAYNDIVAIGAIRALREANLRVPEDISVVGFDDIRGATYVVPSITTVRQPLHKMGEIAGETLVERIEGKEFPEEIHIEPEFVVRESSGPART